MKDFRGRCGNACSDCFLHRQRLSASLPRRSVVRAVPVFLYKRDFQQVETAERYTDGPIRIDRLHADKRRALSFCHRCVFAKPRCMTRRVLRVDFISVREGARI